MSNDKLIWAIDGESHAAPENTMPAYWGAVGAGADGLMIGVQLTSDNRLVCCRNVSLFETCGVRNSVSELSLDKIRNLDAGSQFRSAILDDDHQPTDTSEDTPWIRHSKADSLYHPELSEVLLRLSRRTQMLLQLVTPKNVSKKQTSALVTSTANTLQQFGLTRSALIAAPSTVLTEVRKQLPNTTTVLLPDTKSSVAQVVSAAKKSQASYVLIDAERLTQEKGQRVTLAKGVSTVFRGGMRALVTSTKMPFALAPKFFDALVSQSFVAGFACRAVRETAAMRTPLSIVMSDEFSGKSVNREHWVAGYSKATQDTKISINDALIIDIKQGGVYSGGALLTSFLTYGNFDARVAFHVTNPQQGTTFELAAIQVDPGYHHISNSDLNRKNVNLTFDVHGAPPYASSERDENDGFRIGWNNGPALTEFPADPNFRPKKGSTYIPTIAQSNNLYNKYSRDVGDAKSDNPSGQLRLVRTGDVFNAYYTDAYNPQWVLCGTAVVPTLANGVFLRLGAKHWPKRGRTPPKNRITFKQFELSQPNVE